MPAYNYSILNINEKIAQTLPYRGRESTWVVVAIFKELILKTADDYIGSDWEKSLHDNSQVDVVADQPLRRDRKIKMLKVKVPSCLWRMAAATGFAPQWKDYKCRLIISTGRTGTSFLGEFFCENADGILSCHEPNPDLFDVGIRYRRHSCSLQRTVQAIRIARLNQQFMMPGHNYYVESNPNLVIFLPALTSVFPNLKIAFIVRDLPSYLVSAYHNSPDGSGKMFFYSDDDHRDRLRADDVGQQDLVGDWESCAREVKISWWWKYANECIIEFMVQPDCPAKVFHHEHLFHQDRGIQYFRELIHFLDFGDKGSIFNSKIETSINQKQNSSKRRGEIHNFDDFSAQSQKTIGDLVRGTRAALGYPLSI